MVKRRLNGGGVVKRRDLLHVAAQFGVWGLVDSVPVHLDLDFLVKLEDHERIIDVSETQQ